uniref:Uncharacterized protein n=1 Tax=Rhodosorus marinus TaxID=101924 RepID=A0A7S3ELS7_9RHOD|mmetsp:Transcript_43640/g.170759  ORF Transcript_43640/g.170759 Transcript_43640/m.170759 type:complete len:184 (+) Transcript_43640:750-1301(+)
MYIRWSQLRNSMCSIVQTEHTLERKAQVRGAGAGFEALRTGHGKTDPLSVEYRFSVVAGKTEKGIRAKETVERSNTDPVVEETGESSMAEENIDYEVQETPPVEQQQTPGPTMFEKDVSEETADVPSETGLSRGEAMNTKGKDSSGRMEALQKNPTGPGERFLEDELNAGELEPQNPKSNPEG